MVSAVVCVLLTHVGIVSVLADVQPAAGVGRPQAHAVVITHTAVTGDVCDCNASINGSLPE